MTAWLKELKKVLDNDPSKKTDLAMLWLDIKTPGVPAVCDLPNIVHNAGLPYKIDILYDLGELRSGSTGFDLIQNQLKPNEGVSLLGISAADVVVISNFYKSKEFTRGTFNHGHSVGADEDLLAYARTCQFMKSDKNPYGFTMTLTWYNKLEESMDYHIDPDHKYYTDI